MGHSPLDGSRLHANIPAMTDAGYVDVTFGGQEGVLTLSFVAADRVPAGARCERISLTLGPVAAEVSTVLGIDAVRLRDELRSALASKTISGDTRFQSVEGDFRVAITLDHGKGSIVARATTGFARQDGYAEVRLTTDQSFMRATVQQLDAFLTRFPGLSATA